MGNGTVTLEQFRSAAKAGGVCKIFLKGVGRGFQLEIQTRTRLVTLVTTNGKIPRAYADPRKALLLLQELGITNQIEIDIRDWMPERKETDC